MEELELRDYQVVGIESMYDMLYVKGEKGVINADDQGLGKTAQTIGVIGKKEDVHYILIITPLSVAGKGNWPNEFSKWIPKVDNTDRFSTIDAFGRRIFRNTAIQRITSRTPIFGLEPGSMKRNRESSNPRGYIILTTYETVKSEAVYNAICDVEFDLIIADEFHKVKNYKSGNAEAFFSLKSKKHIFLSGTIGDKTDHFFPMVRFFLPEYDNYPRFSMVFSRGNGYEQEDSRLINEALGPYIIRRLKKDVAKDLAPLIQDIITINPSDEFLKTISAMSGDMTLVTKYSDMAMEVSMRMRAAIEMGMDRHSREWLSLEEEAKEIMSIAEEAIGVYTQQMIKGGVMKIRKMIGDEKALPAAEHILERYDGHPFIAFYHHKSVGETLAKYFMDVGLVIARVDGSITGDSRDIEIARFTSGRANGFLASSQATNAGVNLQNSARTYVVEQDWSAATRSQLLARNHRIGQKKIVLASHFIMPNTYDSRMWQINLLKDMIMSVTSGDVTFD